MAPTDREPTWSVRAIHKDGVAALNDYQTFTSSDPAEHLLVLGLRMIAAGVPAWGRDLTQLTQRQAQVLLALHRWYQQLLTQGASASRDICTEGRLQLGTDHSILRFIVDPQPVIEITTLPITLVVACLTDAIYLKGPSGVDRWEYVHSCIDSDTRRTPLHPTGPVRPHGPLVELPVVAGDLLTITTTGSR